MDSCNFRRYSCAIYDREKNCKGNVEVELQILDLKKL